MSIVFLYKYLYRLGGNNIFYCKLTFGRWVDKNETVWVDHTYPGPNPIVKRGCYDSDLPPFINNPRK